MLKIFQNVTSNTSITAKPVMPTSTDFTVIFQMENKIAL